MRIGILGGTFDPIHVGHIAAARVAMDCARLDRVLFIPSATPPHRGPAEADAAERLEMSRLAVGDETRFEVSDVEVRRGGRSFTSDTVRELKSAHPHDELFLILGWDAARLFSTWHEPDQIRADASVIVVGRPRTQAPTAADLRAAGLDPERTVLCLGGTPDISGSELRESLARGEPVGDCLPPAVERYIAEHGLYGDNR
ncbi:MAG TPA: nicotinate (nicotinamide) nucleotide adenylyltransferase [Candidatus Acidoferrum sp.]|nr:nicotinate (nicotinamide) nucleotide adenylyltransferase [Candidatus Acidoferrum sp.]